MFQVLQLSLRSLLELIQTGASAFAVHNSAHENPGGAEESEHLHSKAAGEHDLACAFTHANEDKELSGFGEPGQNGGVAVDKDHVDVVKQLFCVFGCKARVGLMQEGVYSGAVDRLHLDFILRKTFLVLERLARSHIPHRCFELPKRPSSLRSPGKAIHNQHLHSYYNHKSNMSQQTQFCYHPFLFTPSTPFYVHTETLGSGSCGL